MALYAIEIQEKDLDLIAVLNNGVKPKIESETTWLLIDSSLDSDVPNRIVSEEVFLKEFEAQSTVYMYRVV